MKLSKNKKAANTVLERRKEYSLADAVKLVKDLKFVKFDESVDCLLYTSPSPRDATLSRMPSSA